MRDDKATGFLRERLWIWDKDADTVAHSEIMASTVAGAFWYESLIAWKHFVTFAQVKMRDADAAVIESGSIIG